MVFKRDKIIFIVVVVFLLVLIVFSFPNSELEEKEEIKDNKIFLSKDFVSGNKLVFDSITSRRSIRDYSEEPLSLKELSTLLFATQGVTSEEGLRAAPSAGALYPIETYLVVNYVDKLERGLYRYLPEEHALEVVKLGDFRKEIKDIGLGQDPLESSAINFVWTAVFERTTNKYGQRGLKYIYLETGHISENPYLQANSMGMGVVAIGAFDDDALNQFLGVDGEKESVIYTNAVGKY